FFILLSIYCICPVCVLRFFPTRRSSDLGDGGAGRADAVRGPVVALGAVAEDAVHQPLAAPGGAGDGPVGVRRGAGRLVHHRGRADRKSTRLNSSHVKISYAVFCLKKKKK